MLTMATVESQINSVIKLPELAYTGLAVTGAFFLLSAPALLLLERLLHLPRNTNYICSAVERRRIDELHKFAARVIPAELLSDATLKVWQDRQPGCHQFVYRVRRSRSRLRESYTVVGFFTVVRITHEAATELEQPRLMNFRIRPDHLVRDRRRTGGIFIAAVGATNSPRGRGETIAQLKGFVAAMRRRHEPLYARPVTKDGLRLALKNDFVKITSEGELGELIYKHG